MAKDVLYNFVQFYNEPRLIEPASFDRHSKTPPLYLTQLRSRGDRRSWLYPEMPRWSYSAATGSIRESFLPMNRSIVVDAGCGNAPDALWAIDHLNFKAGIKIDLYEVHRYREIRELEAGRVEFIKGDVCEEQPIADESVGLVISNAMIDLIPVADRPLFYKQCYRMLQPGGLLSIAYISLKAGYGWDYLAELEVLRRIGFTQLNRGKNILVMRKEQA